MFYKQKYPIKHLRIMNVFFLFFLSIHISIAQNQHVIDSLLSDLASQFEDTLKVSTLNELSWEYRTISSQKAKDYAKKAIDLSDDLSYERGRITGLVRMGAAFIYERDFRKAEEIYLKVLPLEEKLRNTYGIGRAQNQLAEIYNNTHELAKALDYGLKSLSSFKKIKNENLIATVSSKVGAIYKDLGDYENAMNYLLESIDKHKDLGNDYGVASSSCSIGLLYFNLEDYKMAFEYLNISKELFEDIGDDYELAKVYNNLGVLELSENRFDDALNYFNTSLLIKKQLGIADKDPSIYNNLGNLYQRKNNLNKSLEYYLKGKDVLISTQDSANVDIKVNIADIHYRKNNLDKAILEYLEALAIADKTEQKTVKLKILNDLSLCYSKLGNYNEALKYKNRYVTLNDSLENAYKGAIRLKSDYEEEQKRILLLEKSNEMAEADLKRSIAETKFKDTFIISLILGVLLLVLLFFSILRGNKQRQKILLAKKDKEIELKNAQELINQQELKFNQARLEGQERERKRIAKDLHDRLGSMLSMVKIHYKSVEENIEELKKTNKDQYEKANALLDDACEEVRRIANDINSGILSKFGLVAALEDLANTINETNKLIVEFDVHGLDNRLQSEVEIVVYRVVQELVNNVLKHANATELSIQLMQRDANLITMIEDNGEGFNFEDEKNKGMGLTNVISRIEKLDGDLQVDSSLGNGTTITIEIPL